MLGNDEKIAFKTTLKQACLDLLRKRIANADLAVQEAQASANTQEKSSAGDKYETGRAMAQIDRDLNAAQWIQAKEEYTFLENISVDNIQDHVKPGVVFGLGDAVYFAAVGLGTLRIANKNVIAISCKSPLFQQLKTKKAGDVIVFNAVAQQIADVY